MLAEETFPVETGAKVGEDVCVIFGDVGTGRSELGVACEVSGVTFVVGTRVEEVELVVDEDVAVLLIR